jgi:hypothetical protein
VKLFSPPFVITLMDASSVEKGREHHLQLMTYEIDSHALSTVESGSTEMEGSNMTFTSEESLFRVEMWTRGVLVRCLEELHHCVCRVSHHTLPPTPTPPLSNNKNLQE